MRRIILLIVIALMALGACELFRVRESEPPTKPPLWNNFTTNWGDCVQNLEYCYNDARNVVKYAGIFTPEYRFFFAAQDINDFGINEVFDRSAEQDMLISLQGQCDSLLLDLLTIEGQADDIGGSTASIFRTYKITAYKKNHTEPEHYTGKLELQLKKQNGYWYINKWHDYRSSSTDQTWGKLKHDNSQ